MNSQAKPYRWYQAYPKRWRSELKALRDRGWAYKVVRSDGDAILIIEYPVTARRTARLTVVFPPTYPHFPADVFDTKNQLKLKRHRNPVASGELCLVEQNDYDPDRLVSDLLAAQVPKLIAASNAEPTSETRTPEPVVDYAPRHAPDLVVPAEHPPANVAQGALVVEFSHRVGIIGSGLVTHILGQDVDIKPDLRENRPTPPDRVRAYGRWVRDPNFKPTQEPEAQYRRIAKLLEPLEVPDDDASAIALDQVEVIGILVPAETSYRHPGERWTFLLRYRPKSKVEDRKNPHRVIRRGAQELSRPALAARTPIATKLAEEHIVVVGAGALGAPLAHSLAQAGVGTLNIVDRDLVDITTARRQNAPIDRAGYPKVRHIAGQILASNPYCEVHPHLLNIKDVLESCAYPGYGDEQLLSALHTADLVIDATGNQTVTRYLAALRHHNGGRFMHVSTTAGAWGGVIFTIDPAFGQACWLCLEYHRADERVPVPPADPDGWVVPNRCAEQTWTGTAADVRTIAEHAARTAATWLTDNETLGGTLHVARLRSPSGVPVAVRWNVTTPPRHPACPAHADHL